MSPAFTNTACKAALSDVHLLKCGHYVRLDSALPCQYNCASLWQTPQQTHVNCAEAPWIICRHCVEEMWLNENNYWLQPLYDTLHKSPEWHQADLEARVQLRLAAAREHDFFNLCEQYVKQQEDAVRAGDCLWGNPLIDNGQMERLLMKFSAAMRIDHETDECMHDSAQAQRESVPAVQSIVPPLEPLFLINERESTQCKLAGVRICDEHIESTQEEQKSKPVGNFLSVVPALEPLFLVAERKSTQDKLADMRLCDRSHTVS